MRIPLLVAVAVAFIACEAGGPANGPPSTIIKSAGDAGQAVVGQLLTPAPEVRVTDGESRPVPGATVTFAVASGGGSVASADAVTNADGKATVSGWTLGTTAGTNTLTATVANLAAVTFTATAVAGAATTMEKASTDGGEFHLGSAASPSPAVRLKDTHGNLVSGATVTFAVASGGGTATGTTQTTNTSGVATVGSWTLGSTAGTNTLTASAGSLTATFSVTSVDKCAQTAPGYQMGSGVVGSLGAGDCQLASGHYADRFTITRNALTAFRLDQKSTTVDSRLLLFSQPDLRLVQTSPTGFDASMNFIVGAGSFIVGASTVNANATGAYTLESTIIGESVENCVSSVLVNFPSTSQALSATDCNDAQASGTYYYDRFVIFVQSGQTYCVTQSTSAFNPHFEIQPLSGGIPYNTASSTGSGTRTAKTSFTPNVTEHRSLLATSVSFTQTGAYTLSFSQGTCP